MLYSIRQIITTQRAMNPIQNRGDRTSWTYTFQVRQCKKSENRVFFLIPTNYKPLKFVRDHTDSNINKNLWNYYFNVYFPTLSNLGCTYVPQRWARSPLYTVTMCRSLNLNLETKTSRSNGHRPSKSTSLSSSTSPT